MLETQSKLHTDLYQCRALWELYLSICRGSTYEDLRVDQTQSLSQALQGHTTTAEANTYSDLQEWLAPSTTAPTSDPSAESATSAGMTIRAME